MTGFGYAVLGFGSHPTRGPGALSVSLNNTSVTVAVDLAGIAPDASGTVDTNAGEAGSTATAAGGDGSYTFAWTITETEDDNVGAAACAVLAAGTQNAAQYNTATFRVTQPALISNGQPIEPPPAFIRAVYRLRCTVTDGESDTAVADFIVTVQQA